MEVITRRSLVERMKGAALLDISVYEEVEADSSATGQAAAVVAIVAVCAAIGGARAGAGGAIAGLIAAFVGWVIWSGITYAIGDKLFGGTATWGELLRTLGFAQSPGVLLVLGIIPLLGGLIALVVGVWMLIAGVIAIRQALDFSTGKAVGTAIIGWIVYMLTSFFVLRLLGISAQVI
jgi:hypothetical protein